MSNAVLIRIHDLRQAEAALAAGREFGLAVTLVSVPGAARFAGAGFLQALATLAGAALIADCGDDAGLVLAALRAGCRDILFTGMETTAARLRDIATAVGATLRYSLDSPCVDLAPTDDPRETLNSTGRQKRRAAW